MKNFEQVCRLVRQGLDDGAYPSACLSVGIRGSVCVRQTFGPARETTLYDIASLSKIVGTTMIAFRFLEEGRLRLYDTVEQFFPAPEDKKGITVLQLMTHTSGLPAHFYLSEEADGPGDAVRAILAHPLEHAPGALPVYSCMGYILLGRILEQIGGQSIDRLAQEYVFEPLGLTHTTYRPAGDVAPTERDPATGELLRGAVHDENARFLGGLSGNAGIFSDLCDMTRFVQMLALGGNCRTAQFLSLQRCAPRWSTARRVPGTNSAAWASTWQAVPPILGDLMSPRAYGHTGFTGTSIAVDPDTGLFVVLLTNRVCPTRENGKLIRMRSLIHNAAAAAAGRMQQEAPPWN
ncbi:MAG: serine hydrolase domain-containing protein [Ruthenibacterium lactatiformans]